MSARHRHAKERLRQLQHRRDEVRVRLDSIDHLVSYAEHDDPQWQSLVRDERFIALREFRRKQLADLEQQIADWRMPP